MKTTTTQYHHTPDNFEHFNSPDTYVHPHASIGPNVVLLDGAKVGPYAVITGNVTIGKKVKFMHMP